MSLKQVEMWTIACDECGAEAFTGDDFVAWSDRDGALEVFDETCDDWSTFEDKHRCPKHNPFCTRCGGDAGELSGERDFLCPSCWTLSGGDADTS